MRNFREEMTELFIDWVSARIALTAEHFTDFAEWTDLLATVQKRAAWLDLDDPGVDAQIERIRDWAGGYESLERNCEGSIPGCENGCYCE